MAEIKKEVTGDNKITIFRVTGTMIYDQIIDEITQFYEDDFTDHVIWDLSNADVKNLSSDEVGKIVSHTKEFGHLRDNCKTAFVMSSSLAYGLGRMYDTLTQVADHPVKNGLFRNFEEAVAWIETETE